MLACNLRVVCLLFWATPLLLMFLMPLLMHATAQIFGPPGNRFPPQGNMYPVSPCPDLFFYEQSRTGQTVGHLKIPGDNSKTYDVAVNMSVGSYLQQNQNIKLKLVSTFEDLQNSGIAEYEIEFPTRDLPVLTLLTLNDRELCRGPSIRLEPGKSVTGMWTKSMIRLEVTPVGPPIDNQNGFPGVQYPPGNNGYPPSTGFPSYPGYPGYPGNGYPGAYPPSGNPFPPSNNGFPNTNIQGGSFPGYPVPGYRPPFPNGGYINVRFDDEAKVDERSVEVCGMAGDSQNLIIGGDTTDAGDFPWLAAIMYRQDTTYKFKCTGNLISERHVITAGHCLRYFNAPLVDNEDLVVVLGKHNIENWAHGSVIRDVREVVVNPHYKQNNADSDVAIIVLSEPVTYRHDVRPICVSDQQDGIDDIVGRDGTVVGWGRDNDDIDYSPVAKKIDVPVASQEKCLRSNKVFKKLTSNKTFCAGRRDGTGPCTGDSGAGFMIRDEMTNRWTLRGLAGFSLKDDRSGSCDLNSYVVFTDVGPVHQWIKSVVNNH